MVTYCPKCGKPRGLARGSLCVVCTLAMIDAKNSSGSGAAPVEPRNPLRGARPVTYDLSAEVM